MKTLANKFNQALFFLAIALTATIFVSCKDDKDSCKKCAEEKAAQASNISETDTVTSENANSDLEETAANITTKASVKSTKKTVSNKSEVEKEENQDNVSIINPNDKSNSDSKRTYGSSGTGGGSGTSGSGGDGNGSSGWNADAKKK